MILLWLQHFAPSEPIVVLGIIILAFFLLCVDFLKRRKTWKDYPPGPRSLPFLGNLLQVDLQNPSQSFDQLSKKYGNVFSLQFCWRNVVVLNGYKVLKEAFSQKPEAIVDRPHFPIYDHLGAHEFCGGILAIRYGIAWKEQRRFLISTLKDFGLGKKTMEERVTEEARILRSMFLLKEGNSFDPSPVIHNAVSNVICAITFGDRFEYGDEKFKKLLNLLGKCMKAESGFFPQILNIIPVLLHIPGLAKILFKPERDIMNCVMEYAQEHKATRDPAITRDAIDAFLEEIEKSKGNRRTSFNESNLAFVMVDLFATGTETTSTTLCWGLLYMLLHPDIQSRVHNEIDEVIGRDRFPVLEDLASMHFTNAVIHETQRCGDIVPVPFPRRAMQDTRIHGFFIPKNTTVFTNLSSVLKDKTVWEKADQFYPEHFLDENGSFVRREAFMAFSGGHRVCVGEQLARMELFIFFTSLLQQFIFRIPAGQPKPPEDAIYAVTRSPRPFQVVATVR